MENSNVEYLKIGDKEIYLVGTAHVSHESVLLTEQVIRDVQPDTIAVELCASRHKAILDPERWKNTDIVSLFKQGKQYVLLAQLLLSSFQKRLGISLGSKAGAEMIKAIELSNELGTKLVLADREISITMKRTWRSVGFFTGMKLLASLLDSLISGKSFSTEEIERLKKADALEAVLEDISKELPGVRTSLIDERDKYLAESIRGADSKKIVAILGAGHIPGIKRYINDFQDLSLLNTVPPASRWSKSLAYTIPAIVLALIVYGVASAGSEVGIDMVKAWILANSIPAAIGAIIALAHPITIVATAIASPITSLYPFIGVGWVAALVEASLRKPLVSDFETITNDITNIRGIWTNRICRIFLVMLTTTLGGALGTIVGIKWMTDLVK